ncbi:hypothetical protein HRbin36_02123 [bacterium HR36]|nr:hypothetical protein HRbin36_02123 [bacterium HR36]
MEHGFAMGGTRFASKSAAVLDRIIAWIRLYKLYQLGKHPNIHWVCCVSGLG